MHQKFISPSWNIQWVPGVGDVGPQSTRSLRNSGFQRFHFFNVRQGDQGRGTQPSGGRAGSRPHAGFPKPASKGAHYFCPRLHWPELVLRNTNFQRGCQIELFFVVGEKERVQLCLCYRECEGLFPEHSLSSLVHRCYLLDIIICLSIPLSVIYQSYVCLAIHPFIIFLFIITIYICLYLPSSSLSFTIFSSRMGPQPLQHCPQKSEDLPTTCIQSHDSLLLPFFANHHPESDPHVLPDIFRVVSSLHGS